MSDDKRTSYSFQHRGDLPSYDADFTRDAGKSRDDFEESHNVQPKPEEPQPDPVERDAWHVKVNLHDLPQPHPDFAPPNRTRFNAEWEEKRRAARAKLLESRKAATPQKRPRSRDR